MSTVEEVRSIEQQIAALRDQRDALLKASGLMTAEIAQILAMRTPKRTLCQLLRELHDVLGGEQREKIEECLLIAKKMDNKLRGYAGSMYSESWYDAQGKFKR